MTRDNFEKKYAGLAVQSVNDEGVFSGYASLFGAVDLSRDMVVAGAFAKSLANRKASGIRMLFQHDPAEPVGSWSVICEDKTGLYVEGKLSKSVARARELLELMRDGAIDGLSIGFRTVRSRTEAKTGIRHIHEADLWEISIVTFPMLPQARISSVKSLDNAGEFPTTRQFERWLTRDAGLTRSEALHVIRKGFADLKRERDAAQSPKAALASTIRRAAHLLKYQG